MGSDSRLTSKDYLNLGPSMVYNKALNPYIELNGHNDLRPYYIILKALTKTPIPSWLAQKHIEK